MSVFASKAKQTRNRLPRSARKDSKEKKICKRKKEAIHCKQQWINVKDKLPEHRQRVIFKSERFELAGTGVYDYATFRDHTNSIVYDVHSWRPLEHCEKELKNEKY